MLSSLKTGLLIAAGLSGAGALCGLCVGGISAAQAVPGDRSSVQRSDTAVVRLHISKMTCGTCPATARLALRKLPGVYGAEVTLDDSLGVVRYDPRQVTPEKIATHLTQFTGFPATVLGEGRAPGKKPTTG